MPGILTTVVGADVNPFVKDMRSVEGIARATGGRIRVEVAKNSAAMVASNAAATASTFSLSGAMRELLVIFREIGRGNWARVPGSISILADKLGVLKYIFSPVGAIIVAAGVAAYYFWRHLKKVNEELDKTGGIFAKSWGDMAKAIRDASREAANAAADQIDWMRKIGAEHESLASQADERIANLREESRLRREASGNKSKAAELREEAVLRKNELKILDETIAQQQKLVTIALKGSQTASANAETGPEAIRRKARLGIIPEAMKDADENVKMYAAIQRKLQDNIDARGDVDIARRGVSSTVKGTRERTEADRVLASLLRGSGNQNQSVEYEGQKYSMSLKTASELLEKYRRMQPKLMQEQDRLTEVQRTMANLLKDSHPLVEKERESLKHLTSERNKLIASIALHKIYDPAIIAHGGHPEHGSLTSLQKVGAYAPAASNVALITVSKQIHRSIEGLRGDLKKGTVSPSRASLFGGATH